MQIKNVGIEFNTVGSNDLIPIQREDGVTGRATKETILTGITANSGSSNQLDTIISRDTNWCFANRVNQYAGRQSPLWTSFGIDGSGSDSQTGTIKIGYIKLKTKLHILIAGGGSTEQTLKTVKFMRKSDNTQLLSLHLGQILAVDTNDLLSRTINTTSINEEEVYLEVSDNATGGYGWIAFSPLMFVE